MTKVKIIITMLTFTICLAIQSVMFCMADSVSKSAVSKPAYKILHIMSYHSPWQWTDGQFSGFKEAFKGLDVEYRIFQMDTKRHSNTKWKQARGKRALELIDTWEPDLVYTTDDDAQAYVTIHRLNKKTPFVFSGVNQAPETYGFPGSRNVAGVLEQELFTETVMLLKEIVPKVRRIAVVLDDAAMWLPVMERMKEKSARLDGVELVSLDIIKTFAEYKEKIKAYHQTADAIALIGIFNFKNAKGTNVPFEDVLKWTAESSRLPDFSFWGSRVDYGTLCAFNVSPYKQGVAAGRIAHAILTDGKSPATFSMKPIMKGYPIISLARANKLGIRVKSKVLLTAEVVQHFEWEQ